MFKIGLELVTKIKGGIGMVEDNQIKAQVSPFAIREGEIKTFDGKDGYVSMNQIIHKINIGHITDIHFAILELSLIHI